PCRINQWWQSTLNSAGTTFSSFSSTWPTIAVDTHIFRVCNRTQFAPGKNVEQVEEKLLKVVPAEFKVDCHHWLILHGRYTCIARKPRCGSCIIEDLCEY
ncbi:hypothetical protein ACUODJ_51355, partial [Escherichia sp. HC-CC]